MIRFAVEASDAPVPSFLMLTVTTLGTPAITPPLLMPVTPRSTVATINASGNWLLAQLLSFKGDGQPGFTWVFRVTAVPGWSCGTLTTADTVVVALGASPLGTWASAE